MPRKTISFKLDFMIKDIISKFTVKQFDDVTFNITPLMNNVPYTTTNMTGVIYIGCDNDLFQQNTDIVVSSNSINIKLNKAMLQNHGRAYAELELKDSNGTVTSSTFLFNIEKKIGEGATIPGSIEGFVAKYERLIAEFKSQVNLTIKQCNTNVDNKLNTVENLINVKISDFEKRFNRLTSSQQQDAEVVDARDGEVSLKARLDRDIEKAKQVYVNVEGSHISTDSSVGYAKDVEILGNTIQDANNLADIRSVGDKVEGQELYKIPVVSCGKNINSSLIKRGNINANTGIEESGANTILCTENFIPAKPETIYVISSNISIGSILLMCYNENKEYLGYCNISNGSFKTKLGTKYVKFRFWKLSSAEFTDLEVSTIKVQLEEGTQATPYEPYVEDKLTILSPVQLEKVGDIADRIICKDGVWGVEKNVIKLTKFPIVSAGALTNIKRGYIDLDFYCSSKFGISTKLPYKENYSLDEEHFYIQSDKLNRIWFFVDAVKVDSELGNTVADRLTSWLNSNIEVYVTIDSPQFIPLPHDQQVKLRTFANKTNISFLTEIEGTIKAQVPKSLGATINAHTTQISNLNKELDRVKKLEESTVSTVETESDFTTVEATSNGYFEDVKLEGKTLIVNSEGIEVEAGTEGATLKSVGQDVDEIVVSSVNSDNTKSDKKRLLYYNSETQSWEKPILREWDSIEKHSDGKYYYHQRSGEVVLNGGESWSIQSGGTLTNSLLFQASIVNSVIETNGYISPKLLCDKFNIKNHANTYVIDEEAIANVQNLSAIRIRINKSKLSTQDTQGFKQWLQDNNVTVVYQLAEEKVYECTNIDLITYANETNYIVESGAIAPKSILKVHNNISNVVSLLQKKVSVLESNIKASQEVQDMMILETDMRMLDIELALMEFMPMTLNLGGSDMLRSATYFNFLKNHIINETYEKEYLENVMNKYLATGRINQDEYDELYKMLYPPVYDIELPIEY